MVGTPLNISLFLLPAEHIEIARPFQPEATLLRRFSNGEAFWSQA
jgi:hypothetical protein